MPVEMQTHISDILCPGSWAIESLVNLAINFRQEVGRCSHFCVSGGMCHILRSEGLRNHDVLHFKLGDMAAGQPALIFFH